MDFIHQLRTRRMIIILDRGEDYYLEAQDDLLLLEVPTNYSDWLVWLSNAVYFDAGVFFIAELGPMSQPEAGGEKRDG